MRNLLAFLASLLLSFIVVGWWLGWYNFRMSSAEGKPSVTVDFNSQKIRDDMKQAEAYIAKGIADRAARLEADKKAAAAKKAEEAGKAGVAGKAGEIGEISNVSTNKIAQEVKPN